MKVNTICWLMYLCLVLTGACNKTSFSGDSDSLQPAPRSRSGSGLQSLTATATATLISVSDKPATAETDPHQQRQNHPDFDTGLSVAKTRVGINFDDGGSIGSDADRDYNDAVLCFRGEFRVDTQRARVLASKAQTVAVFFTRRAACENAVNILVLHADGSRDGPRQYRAQQNSTISFNLSFAPASELKVELIAGSDCNFFGAPRSMDDPDAAKIEVDVCRTDGE